MVRSHNCEKCGIRIEPGSSNANECAVCVLVQYAVHLHVAPLAAHLRYVEVLSSDGFYRCVVHVCIGE